MIFAGARKGLFGQPTITSQSGGNMTTNPVDAEAAPLREHGGVLGWYRDLPKKNQRTFWACFCGWALDSMDANLYGFVIPSLIALWGISPAQAGSLATISLLASSVGGWLGGIMADRFGRVRTLQITVLWFAVFTLLSGLTSSYSQLFVVRALFGLGFGGEWAAGAILIAEMVKDKHRATAGGTVHSAWAVGSMAASLLYGLYFSIFPQALAWRVLFITGVVPAIFVIFIRRFITEPPIYLENKRRLAAGEESGNVLRIFSPPFLWATFRGCLLAAGIQGAGYATIIWLPSFLKTVRHLSVAETSGYMLFFNVSSFIGYIFGAYASDFLGRRRAFMCFALLEIASTVIYTTTPVPDAALLLLGFPFGLGWAGVYSGLGTQLNELYPTAIRGSGTGFCFNFGRAVGSILPTLVGAYAAALGLGLAISVFTGIAVAAVIVAAFLLHETRGSSLA
jgi:MFS family permease